MDQVFGLAGKRRDKGKLAVNAMAVPSSAVGTIEHDLHRRRRTPLNPFFSKAKVRGVEPIVRQAVDKILKRLDQQAKTGEPTRLIILFAAATHDIISEYCFGQSLGNLDRADLNESFFDAISEGSLSFHFDSYLPWIYAILQRVPTYILLLTIPLYKIWIDIEKVAFVIHSEDLC
jgi:cytochrome P450